MSIVLCGKCFELIPSVFNWCSLRDIHLLARFVWWKKICFEKNFWRFDKMIHSSQVCVNSFEKLSNSFRKQFKLLRKTIFFLHIPFLSSSSYNCSPSHSVPEAPAPPCTLHYIISSSLSLFITTALSSLFYITSPLLPPPFKKPMLPKNAPPFSAPSSPLSWTGWRQPCAVTQLHIPGQICHCWHDGSSDLPLGPQTPLITSSGTPDTEWEVEEHKIDAGHGGNTVCLCVERERERVSEWVRVSRQRHNLSEQIRERFSNHFSGVAAGKEKEKETVWPEAHQARFNNTGQCDWHEGPWVSLTSSY